MFVSVLVCLVDLEIQQLTVVDAEPAVEPSHPHDLVNHVQAIAWHLASLVLVSDDFGWLLVLARFQIY